MTDPLMRAPNRNFQISLGYLIIGVLALFLGFMAWIATSNW